MSNLKSVLILIFMLGLSSIASAQDGTIRGTIIDGANGEPLIGVNILVEGTSRGTSTDVDGKFDLAVPEGTYSLRISYISFQTKTVQGVKVTSGEINVLGTVQLLTETRQMEEVVVTAEAVKDTEAALLTKKKKLPNMIDGISSEVIDQSGISEAAEALKKVTGVSVEGGKYVYVRGLGGRYTKTMLNSVEIPSLDPNRNSLQVDIFPTNLIDNMIISKTAVAELPADFTGGVVNIETKDFPERPIFDISASVTYNPEMHFNDRFLTYGGSNTDFLGFDNGSRELPDGARGEIPNPDFGSNPDNSDLYNFSNSFNSTLGPETSTSMPNYSVGVSLGNQYGVGSDSNKLGYFFTASYRSSSDYYDDYRFGEYQTQTGPTNYDLKYATRQNGSVSTRNVLLSGLAGIAFKTPQSKYKLTGMHLQNGEKKATNFFIDNSEDAVGQSGYLADSYNLEYGERSITNVLLNGNHFFGNNNWEIDWRLSPTFSSITDPDIRNTTYTLRQNGEPFFNSGAGGFPSRLWRFMDETNLVGRINVAHNYELFGQPAVVKFGGSHVYKQRDYEILSYSISFVGSGLDNLSGNPEEILQQQNLFGNGNGGTIYYTSGNPSPNPNAYESNSHNSAFYVSNEFNVAESFKMNLGLRAEQYTLRHTGRDQRFAQGASEGINLDNEKVLDSFDLFPSANLTYFLTDGMNLRFSYSRTIARPTFKELSFAQILDPVSGRTFNGGLYAIGSWDGDLGETRINNFDLRWERFFGGDQLFSAGVFYKIFDDPIELVQLRSNTTGNDYQPRNVGNGEVFGAEFEVRKSLAFFGSFFQHLGFNANLTLVQSTIDMTDEEFNARENREKEGEDVNDTRQMAGQAPFLINAGLTYANPDNGFEGGFFYNVKGETLIRVGGGLFPDVYSEPFHSLNFNLNKSFGRASLSLSVDNILNNSRAEYYQAYRAEDEVFSRFKPHRSVSLGVKYSF